MGEHKLKEAVTAAREAQAAERVEDEKEKTCPTCGKLRTVLADGNLALLEKNPKAMIENAAAIEQLAAQLMHTAFAWRVVLQYMFAGVATTAAASDAERQCVEQAMVLYDHLRRELAPFLAQRQMSRVRMT